jgi:hypothetical protein
MENMIMRIVALASLALVAAGPALAAGKCNAPSGEWQPPEALQTKLESQGWKVRQIKTEDGCYEAFAVDADGKRLEALFDPKTLEAVGEDGDEG